MQLDSALAAIPGAEKDDILREIRAHIMDSLGGMISDEAAVERVLQPLGSTQQLAERYRTEFMLAHAGRSFSPWLLVRTTWRWAKTGVKGFMVFLLALVGYGTGAVLTITLLMKPLMPSRVGLWVGPGTVEFGTPSNAAGLHEVLGQWYIPFTTALAFGVVVGTSQLLRWLIRKRTPWAAR